LTWEAPSSDGGSPITSYKIFIEEKNETNTYVYDGPRARVVIYTNLTNGQLYTFVLTAVNAIGESTAVMEVAYAGVIEEAYRGTTYTGNISVNGKTAAGTSFTVGETSIDANDSAFSLPVLHTRYGGNLPSGNPGTFVYLYKGTAKIGLAVIYESGTKPHQIIFGKARVETEIPFSLDTGDMSDDYAGKISY
jgi:hypothetical protein